MIRWKSWHRWSALCLLAYIYLAVTAAAGHVTSTGLAADPELIPLTIPELLRLLRGLVIPQPRQDQARQAHQHWNAYADTTP